MAEFDNSLYLNKSVALSDGDEDSELGILRRYDRAMAGGAGLARAIQFPASFGSLTLPIASIAGGATEKSVKFNAPFPMRVFAIDVGAETSAGSALTADIHVDGATILDAPEDIHTGVGTAKRIAPEDGSEDIAAGQSIELVVVSTAGTATGAVAHLWYQRL